MTGISSGIVSGHVPGAVGCRWINARSLLPLSAACAKTNPACSARSFLDREGRSFVIRRRGLVGPALAVLAIVVLAACGGSNASSGTSGSAGSAAASGGSTAAAQAASGVKTGPKDHQVTIGWLDVQVSAPIQDRFYLIAQQAAADLGWKIDFQNMDGNIAAGETEMAGLLANHVQAIFTNDVEPSWITQELAAAKAQGVPVFQVGAANGPDASAYKGQYAGVYVEDETALAASLGQAMNAQLAQGGQWGAVLVPIGYDADARFAAVKSSLAGNSKVKLVATANVTLTDRVSQAAAAIKSMLEANPNITALFGPLDFAALSAGEALQETHLAGKVKVYSFYLEQANLQLMKASPATLTAVADSNIAEDVLVGFDQAVNKLLLGKPIQFTASPLIPYFYKTYTLANLPTVIGDQGPVPFNTLIAPYLARWQNEGVLAQ